MSISGHKHNKNYSLNKKYEFYKYFFIVYTGIGLK